MFGAPTPLHPPTGLCPWATPDACRDPTTERETTLPGIEYIYTGRREIYIRRKIQPTIIMKGISTQVISGMTTWIALCMTGSGVMPSDFLCLQSKESDATKENDSLE